MFAPEVYQQRQRRLMDSASQGLLLFIGHVDAPMNYQHNAYPFVQDSSFRYLFGLNQAGLAGVLDCDQGTVTLFGDDLEVEQIVWNGVQAPLSRRGASVGVELTRPYADLATVLRDALLQGISIRYLPPYRGDTVLELARLLGRTAEAIKRGASSDLADWVIALREIKGPEEVAEIERALEVTSELHVAAMRASRPGVLEREVVGVMEGIMRQHDWHPAYACIFSRRGEVLHNLCHDQELQAGDLVVNDSGVCADSGYASDITRTIPVGGRFSTRQRALYQTVLDMQLRAIAAIRPGVTYLEIHKLAALSMAQHLGDLGFFHGDPEQIVESGAYALAFPHGLGHQLGLDVHDMESLGEDRVGYAAGAARSELFGLGFLRLAKELKAGMVLTVEPGIYFIPALIEAWQIQGKFSDLINYEQFMAYRDFGGIRIEDNVLVTESGCRVLSAAIAKSVEDLEQIMTC